MDSSFSKTSLNSHKKLHVDITFGEQIIASSVGALATSLIGFLILNIYI